jgi:RimJ/RimL family protein N-acetyltransferase
VSWSPEVELRGEHAWLVPLRPEHAAALAEASAEGELWRIWYTNVPKPEDMTGEIDKRLAKQAAGNCLPFAAIDPATGLAVGMTCYWNLDAEAKRVEIGATWYRRSVQRSPLNTECKRMLLGHAFETLDCIAVEFRTHFLNQQSRRAIERLGARLDGVLRNHIRDKNGDLRDTCVYSIIASEWPAVRTHLDWQLAKPRE